MLLKVAMFLIRKKLPVLKFIFSFILKVKNRIKVKAYPGYTAFITLNSRQNCCLVQKETLRMFSLI